MSEHETPPIHDDVVARALRDLPVPEHGPTFWADLDRALAEPAVPATGDDDAPALPDPTVHRLDTGELPSVTALAPERAARRSRRSPLLAAAAAAIVLVTAVGLVLVTSGDDDGGDDDAELADGANGVTTTISVESTTERSSPTTAPPATTAVAVDPGTPTGTVMAWLDALGTGDVEAAAALTGPRTVAYLEAATDGVEPFLRESQEGYGAWSAAPDLEIVEIPLGAIAPVGGQVTIVVVTGTNPGEGRDGPTTDVFPVVDTGEGWRVEHLAFDPSREGNIPIVQIPSAPAGQSGFGSLPSEGAVEVIVPAAGTVVFRIDDNAIFTKPTTGVGPNDDPFARYDPEGSLAPGEHQLVVIGLGDDGTIAAIAGPFSVAR